MHVRPPALAMVPSNYGVTMGVAMVVTMVAMVHVLRDSHGPCTKR